MGNRGAKIGGPDSSTTKLNTSTSSPSTDKHTEEFKFFDKALKVVDAERKTKLRRKFRDLVRESKTATIKWQKLPELFDEDVDKWRYNYFNALRGIIKIVQIAYDNRNPVANYEFMTNLINLATNVIDHRKSDLKCQERKGANTEGLKMALMEWGHARKKLQRLLSPSEPKQSSSKENVTEENGTH